MSINLAGKEHQSFWLFCVLLLQPEKKPKTHRTRNISSQFTLCSFTLCSDTGYLTPTRVPWQEVGSLG